MNENNDEELLQYVFLSFLNLRARFEANDVILNALLDTVIEHAPELIEPLKERILGVSQITDIQIKNSYTSGESEIFNDHINSCINRFELIENGSKFLVTKIKFENKNN